MRDRASALARPTPDLLARFAAGDTAAYETLFERYRQPLLRFIRSHSDAGLRRQVSDEDLLQETHLAALKGIATFTYRRQLSFFFWLCRIARNRIYYHSERLARRPPVLQPRRPSRPTTSQDLLAAVADGGASPERQLLLREHLDLLAAALEALPDRYREAVILRRLEGHDNRTAASRLGISPNAMSVRLSRGLRLLAGQLATLLGEAPVSA